MILVAAHLSHPVFRRISARSTWLDATSAR